MTVDNFILLLISHYFHFPALMIVYHRTFCVIFIFLGGSMDGGGHGARTDCHR